MILLLGIFVFVAHNAGGVSVGRHLPEGKFHSETVIRPNQTVVAGLGSGATVTIPPGAAHGGNLLTVTSSGPPQNWIEQQVPLRPPVHLQLFTGNLTGTATIEFPYSPADVPSGLSADDVFGVSTFDDATQSWFVVPTHVDSISHMIVAEVTHFSWWEPWKWDWSSIGARLSQDVLQALGKRISAPTCTPGTLPSYVASFIGESDASVPLYSCAENDSGQLVAKLGNNRNYAVVLSYGTSVKFGYHDDGGSPVQFLISKLLDSEMATNQLYIPPLSDASVGIPDNWTGSTTFTASPTSSTVFADIAQLVFGFLSVPGLDSVVSKMASACGQFLVSTPLHLDATSIFGLITSIGDCMGGAVQAVVASGALDGLKLTQLDSIASKLHFLAGATLVGDGVNLGAELGDLILGGSVDKGLRSFTVFHRSEQAPTPSVPVTPPPTSPPVVTVPPSPSFTVGSAFDDYCIVAWPTAPTTTSDSIEMTMTCQHVPEGEFLFTHVIYGDPNLDVTPSTGEMHIIGRVADVATSDYGYKELVVNASRVVLPSG